MKLLDRIFGGANHKMSESNFFQSKISSTKILIIAVLGLWAIALGLSLGHFFLEIREEVTIGDIPDLLIGGSISLLFLSGNFLNNTLNVIFGSISVWIHLLFLPIYWIGLAILHIFIFKQRYWYLLSLLAAILFISNYRFVNFIDTISFDVCG